MKEWTIQRTVPSMPGTAVTEHGVRFTVDTSSCTECSLLLYARGSLQAAAEIPVKTADEHANISSIEVCGLNASKYEYNYKMDGRIVTDPYASSLAGRKEWGIPCTEHSGHIVRAVIHQAGFDWEGDCMPVLPYSECIMYCLHVRGFTMDRSSGVKNKGTFSGIIEKIPYFEELGINVVELLPCFDFNELRPFEFGEAPACQDKQEQMINYWGFTNGYYFAPKASYCASDDPETEFKEMVRALHRHGIEVIIDFYFEDMTNPVLIQDCLRYWTQEYHVDGFHLSGRSVPFDILARDPWLRDSKLMTEWFDENKYTEEGVPPGYLAEYNDGFKNDARCFLKGDINMLRSFLSRFIRNEDDRGIINYIAGEQGFTLMDMVSYESKHNEDNGEKNQDGTVYNYSWNCGEEGPSRKKTVNALRTRMRKNALLAVLLSQGTPLILAGDEFGNTKCGNNNAYCQDNKISWLDWHGLNKSTSLFNYTKEMIAFRKSHPILHPHRSFKMIDTLSCGYPELSYHGINPWHAEPDTFSRQVGILYCGRYEEKESGRDAFVYIGFNMHWSIHDFSLPPLPDGAEWRLVCSTYDDEALEVLRADTNGKGQLLRLPPRTVAVLTSVVTADNNQRSNKKVKVVKK